MYKKLLISAGGGIISRSQQAEQNEAATIAIGLGGTGISCLRALKREVFDRLKPDDNSKIPSYSHIKFLAVDSDEKGLADTGKLDSLDKTTEFLNISNQNIQQLLRQDVILKNKPYLKWLKARSTQDDNSGIKILSADAGAGGVRQIGRLLLYQNVRKFLEKVTNLVSSAVTKLPGDAEINIHVFTGMGGGTGAGTFLDVCYLIRYALERLGMDGRVNLCGYFFLPDVNITKVGDPNTQEYIKSNGYVSMKELDYCMNFETNGGEWNEVYDGFTYKTSVPPVDLAHLITATDASGAVPANGYDYAMHVVVDYVMDFLVKPQADDTKTDNPFTIKSHISNFCNQVQMVNKEHGAVYNYCVLGASNAYLPYREITTYLASKIFEGFDKLENQLPTESEIELMLQNIGLGYNSIMTDLKRNVPSVPIRDIDTKTLYEQTEGLKDDTIPQVLAIMRDSLSKISGELTANKKAMLTPLGRTTANADRNVASLITRLQSKLLEVAGQADKGPYYAGAVVYSVESKDVHNIVDGYIAKCDRELSNARADLTLRQERMSETLHKLQNSRPLGRKKCADAYVNAVHSNYVQEAEIERLSDAKELLTGFKNQLTDLHLQFYSIYETVMRMLEQTFSANLSALANPVEEDTSYAEKLMTIQDLKKSLDESVSAMRIDDLISGFTTYMLNNSEEWLAQDENKIAFAVSAYFQDVLSKYTSRTMIDYLKIKFGTQDPNVITNKVYQEIIQPLARKATPLFWIAGGRYDLETAGKLGFCTIPRISPEITAAANKHGTAENYVTIRPSYNSDRISFLIFKCGVPLYGYQGVEVYKNSKSVTGAYLHEGASGDDRDWRSLSDITPFSCISEAEQSASLKDKSKIYDEAFGKGIIARKDVNDAGRFDYAIYEADAEQLKKSIDEMNSAIASGDAVTIEGVLKKYTGEGANDTIDKRVARTIENEGAPGCEDLYVKDLVLASQVIMEQLSEQLKELGTYKSSLGQLQNALDKIENNEADGQLFAGALCTGVIKLKNNYTYVYETVSYGIAEETELTTIDAQPFGEHLPLYSAYLGFAALDSETKEKISAAIKDKKVNHGDEVYAAAAKIKELTSDEKVNAMVQRAKKSFGASVNDIVKFLQDLRFEISNF